jgi:hypothetical protein
VTDELNALVCCCWVDTDSVSSVFSDSESWVAVSSDVATSVAYSVSVRVHSRWLTRVTSPGVSGREYTSSPRT